ncbi:MAG: hypothetical protein ABW168_12165, partial [Sedimenticola sp.]
MALHIGQKIGGLPILYRLLSAFIVSSFLIIVSAGTVYYFLAMAMMSESARFQTHHILGNAIAHFNQLYTYTLAGDLTLLETMPSLNNFLTGRPYEQRVYRYSIERQFLQVNLARDKRYLSISYVDQFGKEQIATEGNLRRRQYHSVLQGGPPGSQEEGVKQLFLRLKSAKSQTILFAGPYIDADEGAYFITGISKHEPEISGFGGVILVKASLADYIRHIGEMRIFNRHLAWLLTPNGKMLLRPPGNGLTIDPRPYLYTKSIPDELALIESQVCRFGTDKGAVLQLVLSIPQK